MDSSSLNPVLRHFLHGVVDHALLETNCPPGYVDQVLDGLRNNEALLVSIFAKAVSDLIPGNIILRRSPVKDAWIMPDHAICVGGNPMFPGPPGPQDGRE